MVIMEYVMVIMFMAYYFSGEEYPILLQREVTFEECFNTQKAALEYEIIYSDEEYGIVIECVDHPADNKA